MVRSLTMNDAPSLLEVGTLAYLSSWERVRYHLVQV